VPISPLVLQRRHAELGRIRLGQKVPVGTSGKTRPGKLDRFRFTSPQRDLIEAVASLYGGEARPWDNGGKPEFEVITAATSIPVIVVKGGLSQWMEFWSGGGCLHRCDGQHNVLTDRPCDLTEVVQVGRAQVNPHAEARPTTRLSVMLRDVESMGVWRMETHGWNAAAEIPAMAELAMYVGDLVPANLHLVERRVVKDGQTSRFVVPVLDLAISKQRLVEIVGAQTGSVSAISGAPQGLPQIAAAPTVDYMALASAATTVEEVRAIWQQAKDDGRMVPSLDDALKSKAAEVGQQRAAQITPAAAPAPDLSSDEDDEVEDFMLSADQEQAAPSATAIWAQIVAEAGEHGWTTSQLLDAFDSFSGGVAVADADGFLMDGFVDALRRGDIRQAVSA